MNAIKGIPCCDSEALSVPLGHYLRISDRSPDSGDHFLRLLELAETGVARFQAARRLLCMPVDEVADIAKPSGLTQTVEELSRSGLVLVSLRR
jgi:hypothetical protein